MYRKNAIKRSESEAGLALFDGDWLNKTKSYFIFLYFFGNISIIWNLVNSK